LLPSGLDGQAVRAPAIASSDADTIVAGTLEGVHRSRHAAKSWERTPPEHHQELRNLDSLAVGFHDPRAIYAGTFHLPWETSNGGRTRRPIDDGMIDDSDVMSLPVDRATLRRAYAGACSGIYRSDNHPAGSKKSPDPQFGGLPPQREPGPGEILTRRA
jgi:hypothetical protein